ncbi:MAG: hypothetical protein CBB68_02015 [Rhodospirillaceae bacterium TMED8]|nr:hypothetical protein [Magnetovibrio sp.]OUT52153.1 MAG: hypothetical protein CBB68_02015 [Rhodospirillaceae bacterium TMED8]
MAVKANFEQQFLDLRGKTFLGKVSLITLTRLYAVIGVIASLAIACFLLFADERMSEVIEDWRYARDINLLTAQIELGFTRARVIEKAFSADKKPVLIERFTFEIDGVENSLNRLDEFTKIARLRHNIPTLRDGIVQYNDQFGKFIRAEEKFNTRAGNETLLRIQAGSRSLASGLAKLNATESNWKIININLLNQKTNNFISEQGIEEVKKEYHELHAFLDDSSLTNQEKTRYKSLVRAHETDVLAVLNLHSALEIERGRLKDITAYIESSVNALTILGEDQLAAVALRVDRAQVRSRYVVGGGIALVIMWLICGGILLFRGISGPINSLAETAIKLANSDRGNPVPNSDNIDAIGKIARALQRWTEDIQELEITCRQLERFQIKNESASGEWDHKAQIFSDTLKNDTRLETYSDDAILTSSHDLAEKQAIYKPLKNSPPGDRHVPFSRISNSVSDQNPHGGPVSVVSEQLAYYSDYASVAARDVERTRALIGLLSEATDHIEVLASLVESVTDRVDFVQRRLPKHDNVGSETVEKNSTAFSPENHDFETNDSPDLPDILNFIRTTNKQVEQAVKKIRLSTNDVSSIAQEIATTASNQAVEASKKLLAQSQHFQNMLTDIIDHIPPSTKNRIGGRSLHQEITRKTLKD